MSLALLTGPAGSGKTGEILDRFTAVLDREPVLVLPTRGDVQRFEDELLARRPVAVGGRLLTFEDLFGAAGRAAGAVTPPVLGAHQRTALAAAVVREARLLTLAGPAARRGFAAALDRFVAEARAARIELPELATRLRGLAAGGGSAHLRELATLCEGYEKRLARLGRTDRAGAAEAALAALAADPDAWGGRPVFLYGFDDLTRQQLALIGALAGAADVVVALIHEQGRACLAARERLLGLLLSLGAEREPPLAPHEGTGLLSHLERGFLEEGAGRREPDGSLVLLDASGELAEVEQVGAEIAALIRAGAAPGDVAVIVRSPDAHAALVERVFASYGVPAAIDARLPFGRTVPGRGLVALMRAALTTRRAADLVAYLRTPGRAATPNQVDRLERAVRVDRLATADDAAAAWAAEDRRELWELARLRGAAGEGPAALVAAVADLARDMFEWQHRRRAPLLGPADRRDQLAVEQAGRALRELADLCALDASLAPGPEELVELLDGLPVRRSAGAAAGCVEVTSPYRARARRFAHVFALSLQEGEFPRHGREDPFLTEGERVACGLPARADQRDEERYLFYSCISRPLRRLHLSFRSADDDGRQLARSFFVDDVLDLVAEGAERRLTRHKSLSDTVFRPAEAPSERELARSLAARGRVEAPAALGAEPALAARLAAALGPARERARFLPGDISVPRVREELAARRAFGASSLEQYAECPFRYFVRHELRPRELVPDADELARGTLIHRVLERLYEERGGPERARELLAELAAGTPLAPTTPAARAVYRRIESDVVRFVEQDAAHPVGLPVHAVEAGFGRDGDEAGPLELGDGVALHGQIDRIDGAPGGPALIRDYKSGRNVASRAQIESEVRLQLPLYMLAVRELFGMEPAGAVYHPLGRQDAFGPRGLLRGPASAAPFEASLFTSRDFTADEAEFEECLDEARRRAIELAGKIRAGRLDRDPLKGSCPRHCNFHAICRRDRGEKNPEEEPKAWVGDA